MKRPKCPVCNELMVSVYIIKNGNEYRRIGYYCKLCDRIDRKVFIGLRKVSLLMDK